MIRAIANGATRKRFQVAPFFMLDTRCEGARVDTRTRSPAQADAHDANRAVVTGDSTHRLENRSQSGSPGDSPESRSGSHFSGHGWPEVVRRDCDDRGSSQPLRPSFIALKPAPGAGFSRQCLARASAPNPSAKKS